MIDKNTARSIALEEIERMSMAEDCVIFDQDTLEREYGWVFFWHSQEYEEGDNEYTVPGRDGPLLVLKKDGEVFQFDAERPIEWSLSGYENGFRQRSGKLTIYRVHDMNQTLSYLFHLPLYFDTNPVSVAGFDLRVPEFLLPEQIKLALDNLPAVFEDVVVSSYYGTLLEMEASKCCDYTIEALSDV